MKSTDNIVRRVEGTRKRYGFTEWFEHELGYVGSGLWINIPPIDQYDFDVSVPRYLEWAQSPHELCVVVGAGIHDYMLENGWDPIVASAEMKRVVEQYGGTPRKGWKIFFSTFFVTAL